MSERLSIAEIQRLCELAKKQLSKKDKTLKKPKEDAAIEEKLAYRAAIYYSHLLDTEALQQALKNLKNLVATGGSDAKEKNQPDIDLLEKALRILQERKVEVSAQEKYRLMQDAMLQLGIIKNQDPDISEEECLCHLNEKYFYILSPSELLGGSGKEQENPELFSKGFIEGIQNLYKKKDLYKEIILEESTNEKHQKSLSFELFQENFSKLKEVEKGKQRINKENCAEYLQEIEKQLLVPIKAADGSLKTAMFLAIRNPECIVKLCESRDLDRLQEKITFDEKQTELYLRTLVENSNHEISKRTVLELAPHLNIEFQIGNAEKQTEAAPDKASGTGANLALIHTYILKEMPEYLQNAKNQYDYMMRLNRNAASSDWAGCLNSIKPTREAFETVYQKWRSHRDLIGDIDLTGSEEAYHRIAASDREMESMLQEVEAVSTQLERELWAKVQPYWDEIGKIHQKFQDIVNKSYSSYEMLIGSKRHSGKEKKKALKTLQEVQEPLQKLLNEMSDKLKEWRQTPETKNTLINSLNEKEEKAQSYYESIQVVVREYRKKQRKSMIKRPVITLIALWILMPPVLKLGHYLINQIAIYQMDKKDDYIHYAEGEVRLGREEPYSAHGAKFQQTDLTMGGERWLNGVSLLADGRAYSNNNEAYVTYELGAKYNRLSLKFVPGSYTNTEFDISNAENGDVLYHIITSRKETEILPITLDISGVNLLKISLDGCDVGGYCILGDMCVYNE
ncbi:hypothetical protein [uncultured Clostridium sp.]|uniref:hypothetical protein n=1 Tax=uncultured Clostridium sp. TaxID=59620 RepID=UPI0025CF609F|nr:hypothetical protein [uncultured Clostridium sp.]